MEAGPGMKRPHAGHRCFFSRGATAGAGCVLAVALVLAWTGCTVTESNYKMLSYFFDGVPDPNAPVPIDGGTLVDAIRRSPTYTVHKPYEADACAECHSSRFRLTRNDSPVCLKCHADQVSSHPRMHGPVAAGACLWCHSPHDSAYAHLLRDRDRPLCMQCHEQGLLSTATVPAHADASRGCLECHAGHGGAAALFLRAEPPAEPPPP